MEIAERGDYKLITTEFDNEVSYAIVNKITDVVEFRGVVLPEAYEVMRNLDKGLTKAQQDLDTPKVFQH